MPRSACGTYRTWAAHQRMSAFGGKTDTTGAPTNVCLADMVADAEQCLLLGVKRTSQIRALVSANDPKQTYRVFSCSEAVDLSDQRRQRRSNLVVKSPGYLLPPSPVSY